MIYANVKVSINVKTRPKNFCTIRKRERIVKQQRNESVGGKKIMVKTVCEGVEMSVFNERWSKTLLWEKETKKTR